jgi:uncharacterized protein with GYD domain
VDRQLDRRRLVGHEPDECPSPDVDRANGHGEELAAAADAQKARAEAFKQMASQMGCTVRGLFFTMGRYDIAARIEAPDDETVSALMLKLGQLGNVRSETMRAFTEEEFAAVLRKAVG